MGLLAGQWTTKETAELLGMSTRHIQRLKSAFWEEGIRALVHGNRRLPDTTRVEICVTP